MSLAKVPQLFKCAQCGKEYNKYRSFRFHMETHNGNLHECDQCEKKYKSREALLHHRQTAHVEAGQHKCDECGKLCPHKVALRRHKRRVHSDSDFECPVCGKKTRLQSSSQHTKTHAEKREEYRCVKCPKTFKCRRGREKHMKREHSDSRFACDSECDLHSATLLEYRDHLTSRHSKQHPATCKCISIDVVLAQQIATNLGSTTVVEAAGTLKCTDGCCDFATSCARQMESHKEQCHRNVYHPVLRCSSCDAWFASPNNLKRHNADKHQGERRFKCVQCGYITNDKGSINRHQTKCKQGKALGNRRMKQAKPSTENLDFKKESPRDVYQFGSMIGEGGFGTVYKAVKKGQDPSVKYAIKEVGPNGGKSAELEAKLMRQFEQKNLMALLEYYECEAKGRLTRFIVMEYCRPGSLTDMQKLAQFQFEEPHVLYILKEVTCGLEHLHSAGVIHRDLKSANVLVNERAEVKISDFGVSTDGRIA
ncbi:Protein kinase [Aphelenchoides avenae]|nr:Protein kinase [Aphelenchus avenae]